MKETRRSVRDSEAGLEKLAVGHHLGKFHILEEKSLLLPSDYLVHYGWLSVLTTKLSK